MGGRTGYVIEKLSSKIEQKNTKIKVGYGALYLASFVMICDIECVSLMFVSLYIHQSLV